MRKYLILFAVLLSFQANLYSQIDKFLINHYLKTNEHWLFTPPNDTITGNWTYIDSLPQKLFGVNSIYLPSLNKIFICGGADQNAVPKRACYFYNLSTNLYETADSLPTGRILGKLVNVYDSLYLIGSVGSDFNNTPDGATFKFDFVSNKWVTKSTMPSPHLQECAVCVWYNKIVTIGGATSGFNPTDYVRTYDPVQDVWYTSVNPFIQPTTCSAAECIVTTNSIIVVGGWGGVFSYNDVFRGTNSTDSIDRISWDRVGNAPYPTGIYRPGSCQFWGYLIFGPAIYFDEVNNRNINYGQVWSFNIADSSWRRFLPNTIDSIGDIPTISVNPNSDSIYFYLFGGNDNRLNILNKAERFSFSNPYIGIHGITKNIPKIFELYQNFPNPFNPATNIKYQISKNSYVRLAIFDILGREIAIVVNEHKTAGTYTVNFDASKLASGVYIYRLIAGDFVKAKKMLLIK